MINLLCLMKILGIINETWKQNGNKNNLTHEKHRGSCHRTRQT